VARRSQHTARRAAAMIVLTGFALALGGCQLRVATDITVDADGGGDVVIRVLVDDELRDALVEAGVDLQEGLDDAAVGASWTAKPIDNDEGAGVELRTSFSAPQQLGERVAALAAGLTTNDGALLRDVVLERTPDGGYAFRAEAGINPPAIVGSVPSEPDAEARFDGGDLAAMMLQEGDTVARADLRVTFPTVPVSPDGTVETTVVTWKLPVDGLASVSAVAPPVPVGMTAGLAIAAAVAGLLIGVFAIRSRRR
jgi:hypothetical protein